MGGLAEHFFSSLDLLEDCFLKSERLQTLPGLGSST